jgi:glycosyltransferase involved in cell wall biosynthesis
MGHIRANALAPRFFPATKCASSIGLADCACRESYVTHLMFMHFIVFSHLRWDFVYQRPQHVLSRCARENRVVFWEEPVRSESGNTSLRLIRRDPNLTIAIPELPIGMSEQESVEAQGRLLSGLLAQERLHELVFWYYTPSAIRFAGYFQPAVTVYDCMDELSAFRGAPPGLTQAEKELFEAADLVFTGGQSLYKSKRDLHRSVHLFPSSIDFDHFAQARTIRQEPPDQATLPRPRFGYCGVIDERLDTDLLAGLAELRPEWHFVMVGPVVKISEEELPKRHNIHYLGAKTYQELPAYLAGWNAALMPFAINESTRFISPTKTPEYLAAGRPVVSTAITDVVTPYGELGLVAIATNPDQFASALEQTLRTASDQEERSRLSRVDTFLERNSWDITWRRMKKLVLDAARQRGAAAAPGVERTRQDRNLTSAN